VGIERNRELRKRRNRRKTVAKLGKKAVKASQSEKVLIAAKLRKLTPGAEIIIARWGLEGR